MMTAFAAMAGGSETLIVVGVGLVALLSWIPMVVLMLYCYKKVPAGKVMVIHKMQRTQVTRRGSLVLPMVWSHAFVHAEAEEVEYDTPDGPETILVALGDTEDDVMKAHTKFGQKSVDEIKAILKRILENTSDQNEDLAKVGYKVVC